MRVNLHYHELLNHTSFYRCLGPFIAMAEPKGAHTVRCLPSAPTWAYVMHGRKDAATGLTAEVPGGEEEDNG